MFTDVLFESIHIYHINHLFLTDKSTLIFYNRRISRDVFSTD